MKRIALIGAALGALAGRALGSIGGSEVYQQTAQSHHNYRRKLLRISASAKRKSWILGLFYRPTTIVRIVTNSTICMPASTLST